jgi:transcriptional regulator with XRE-family HTH domain
MPVRRRPIEIGAERGRLLVSTTCRQVDEARLDRGLSYAALGRELGLSGQQVARICQGRVASVSLARLARVSALVGLELAARTFPGGQPLRDGAQVALLTRLRARASTAVRWETEVPVTTDPVDGRADMRAWDAVIHGPSWSVGIEAETNLRDVQALLRRLALKKRDGDVAGGVILALSDSRHHRAVVRAAGPALRDAFPVDARKALARLGRGEAPGDAIVLL